MEAWMSTCIFSLRHSRKLTFAALVLCTVSAFAQALPIVQGMQERSAALAKDVYNDSSSSSTDNPCLSNKTALEYGWEVYCPSHPQVCVSATWRCNGIVDCEGLEDEINCSSSEERSFECLFDNVTIYLANDRRCNGHKDCPDGSDEGTDCDCPDGLEFCDSYCLPSSWWCDGEVDCEDGTDESSCTPSYDEGRNTTREEDNDEEESGDWLTFWEWEESGGGEEGESRKGGENENEGNGEERRDAKEGNQGSNQGGGGEKEADSS